MSTPPTCDKCNKQLVPGVLDGIPVPSTACQHCLCIICATKSCKAKHCIICHKRNAFASIQTQTTAALIKHAQWLNENLRALDVERNRTSQVHLEELQQMRTYSEQRLDKYRYLLATEKKEGDTCVFSLVGCMMCMMMVWVVLFTS